jgi:hypothetical protein
VKPSEIDKTIRILENDWKRACKILNQQEKFSLTRTSAFSEVWPGLVWKRAGGSGSGRIRLYTGARADLATCQFLSLDYESPIHRPSFLLKSNS